MDDVHVHAHMCVCVRTCKGRVCICIYMGDRMGPKPSVPRKHHATLQEPHRLPKAGLRRQAAQQTSFFPNTSSALNRPSAPPQSPLAPKCPLCPTPIPNPPSMSPSHHTPMPPSRAHPHSQPHPSSPLNLPHRPPTYTYMHPHPHICTSTRDDCRCM